MKKIQNMRTTVYSSSSYFTSDPDTLCLCHTISPPSVIYISSSALCLGVRNVSDDTVSRYDRPGPARELPAVLESPTEVLPPDELNVRNLIGWETDMLDALRPLLPTMYVGAFILETIMMTIVEYKPLQ